MSQTEDDPDKRRRLRPKSRELKKTGLAKLRACRCFDEVDRRLRLGWSSAELVKFIQDESVECTDVSAGYVRRLVDQHRQSIAPADLSLSSSNTKVARLATIKVSNGLNELAELERLYKLQMNRIDIGFTNEQTIKHILPTTGREVFYAMKILKQSADLKASLGLTKKHLGTVEVTGQRAIEIGDRYGSESIGNVISDPDSRRKLLGLTERLLSMGSSDIDAVFVGVSTRAKPEGEEVPVDVIDVDPFQEPAQENE